MSFQIASKKSPLFLLDRELIKFQQIDKFFMSSWNSSREIPNRRERNQYSELDESFLQKSSLSSSIWHSQLFNVNYNRNYNGWLSGSRASNQTSFESRSLMFPPSTQDTSRQFQQSYYNDSQFDADYSQDKIVCSKRDFMIYLHDKNFTSSDQKEKRILQKLRKLVKNQSKTYFSAQTYEISQRLYQRFTKISRDIVSQQRYKTMDEQHKKYFKDQSNLNNFLKTAQIKHKILKNVIESVILMEQQFFELKLNEFLELIYFLVYLMNNVPHFDLMLQFWQHEILLNCINFILYKFHKNKWQVNRLDIVWSPQQEQFSLRICNILLSAFQQNFLSYNASNYRIQKFEELIKNYGNSSIKQIKFNVFMVRKIRLCMLYCFLSEENLFESGSHLIEAILLYVHYLYRPEQQYKELQKIFFKNSRAEKELTLIIGKMRDWIMKFNS